MNKLSIFLAMIAFPAVMHAQAKNHVLKGRITDHLGAPLHSASVANVNDTSEKAFSDAHGLFVLFSSLPLEAVVVTKKGFEKQTIRVAFKSFVDIAMGQEVKVKAPTQVVQASELSITEEEYSMRDVTSMKRTHGLYHQAPAGNGVAYNSDSYNTESYSPINENIFHHTTDQPLSTFSIDVDRASYSNVRRYIQNGTLPPVDAVRIEELINYFDYSYGSPEGEEPVKMYTAVAKAPWNKDHYLMHIGVKAREIDKGQLPPSNLVFLIDVSGSMNAANKLPLLKSAMKMLVGELRDNDHVAIVVYAGAAGLVLKSTPGYEKSTIYAAIDNLSAGGSTAGGAGIQLAYKVALENFMKNGNNRVILATDGDFNIGASSDGEMQRLIEEKRNLGVYLTVLGFGMGNYKDSKMEILADKGNGNYAYIDNLTEAKKTLVNEFGSTLFTVAKDVKMQVEFNPATVASYRLIGYENRKLNNEDFKDDTKDAGEMGAAHVVTALYEIIPAGIAVESRIDPLKYAPIVTKDQPPFKDRFSNELATVKMRYKEPEESKSKELVYVVQNDVSELERADENLRWSAAVAGFGLLLRKSDFAGDATFDSVIKLAESAVGKDSEGYRRECLQLMRSAAVLSKQTASR